MARRREFWNWRAQRREDALTKIDALANKIHWTKKHVFEGRLDTRTGMDRAVDYLYEIEELSIDAKTAKSAA